jgi:RNA polymerase-binding transcription factor DksA
LVLTADQLDEFRDLLIEQLTGLYRTVRSDLRDVLVRQLFDQDEPRDEADESLRVQLRDARMSLTESTAARTREIEGALARMRQGTYGECIDCGNDIEIERLRLVPWAVRCFDDQQAYESATREHAPTL